MKRILAFVSESELVKAIITLIVYCVDAARQKAFLRYVKIGKLVQGGIEITEGLTADDLIVTAGHQKLADQSSVKIVHS